jgi:hypothetical protein
MTASKLSPIAGVVAGCKRSSIIMKRSEALPES